MGGDARPWPLVVRRRRGHAAEPSARPLVLGILLVGVVARRALPGRDVTAVLLAVLIFGGAQSVLFSRAAAGYRHLPEPTSMDAAQATDRRGTRGG